MICIIFISLVLLYYFLAGIYYLIKLENDMKNNCITQEEFEKLTEEEKEIILKNTEEYINLLEDLIKSSKKSNNIVNVKAIDTKKEEYLFYNLYYTNFVIQYENGDIKTKWVENDTTEFKELYTKIFNY